MKIGQTSLIVFVSKLLGSALGFVATLYFARELGAEVIGLYTLVLTIVGWLILVADLGVGKAVTKRVSESKERGAYLSAALLWIGGLSFVFSVVVIFAEPWISRYVDGFDQYVGVPVSWFIIVILMVRLFYSTVFQILHGEQKVHIAGLLSPVKAGGQRLFQVVLVLGGFSLAGMLVGYVLGGLVVGLLGLYWISTRPKNPSIKHFRSLFNYAKYSWLGSLKGRTFNEVDILLLGVFVNSSLVGVYAVVWSLTKFLDLFGLAISSTMFPEISFTSTQDAKEAASSLVEDSLAFAGLIALPGFVGGGILAERLLRIYGTEFTRGAPVLALLILAILIHSYLNQLLNTFNGIDRPDLAFRINAVFIILNAGLNVILISQYGIKGAAIASVVSVGITLIFCFRTVKRLIDFETPVGEIGRQIVAAALMGVIVWMSLTAIETMNILQHNFMIVTLLVGLGAGVYFVTLLGISSRFRSTVRRNIPF